MAADAKAVSKPTTIALTNGMQVVVISDHRSLWQIARDGPTAEQVDNAKLYLTDTYVPDHDAKAKLSTSLLRLWVGGRAPEFLATHNDTSRHIFVADVRRVAREILVCGTASILSSSACGSSHVAHHRRTIKPTIL